MFMTAASINDPIALDNLSDSQISEVLLQNQHLFVDQLDPVLMLLDPGNDSFHRFLVSGDRNLGGVHLDYFRTYSRLKLGKHQIACFKLTTDIWIIGRTNLADYRRSQSFLWRRQLTYIGHIGLSCRMRLDC